MIGLVVNVVDEPLGSALTADTASGATVLTVFDVGDFRGGTVQVGGAQYTYTDIDYDANTVTLASGLAAAASAGDLVQVWDGSTGSVALQRRAFIELPGDVANDEALNAAVQHQLIPYLPEGIRAPGAEEQAEITDRGGGRWVVTDLPGKQPRAQIVGQLLVYDGGTPEAGNLILAVSGAADVDTLGNDWDAGITLKADQESVRWYNRDNTADPNIPPFISTALAGTPPNQLLDSLVVSGPSADATGTFAQFNAYANGTAQLLGGSGDKAVSVDGTGFAIGNGPRGMSYATHRTYSKSVPTGATTAVSSTTSVAQKSDYGTPWASGVFTAPVDGFYTFHFLCDSIGTATTRGEMKIRKNGTEIGQGNRNSQVANPCSATATRVWFNASDTADFAFFQNTGAAVVYTGFVTVGLEH